MLSLTKWCYWLNHTRKWQSFILTCCVYMWGNIKRKNWNLKMQLGLQHINTQLENLYYFVCCHDNLSTKPLFTLLISVFSAALKKKTQFIIACDTSFLSYHTKGQKYISYHIIIFKKIYFQEYCDLIICFPDSGYKSHNRC